MERSLKNVYAILEISDCALPSKRVMNKSRVQWQQKHISELSGNDVQFYSELQFEIPETMHSCSCSPMNALCISFEVSFFYKLDLQDCYSQWSSLREMVIFCSQPKSGQVLYPVIVSSSNFFSKPSSSPAVLLCKVLCKNGRLFHVFPEEHAVKLQNSVQKNTSQICGVNPNAQVNEVKKSQIVSEVNGARGGRPTHSLTNQLLMTKEQVLKIFEIRKRWEGLSVRQRRDTITAEDFYPFLTLNRDETAEHLGVCATWLKDAIRLQGMLTWPARPLRRSGAYLQNQREIIATCLAKLQCATHGSETQKRLEAEIDRVQQNIEQCIKKRIEIVRSNVTEEYFQEFCQKRGDIYLNPTWNTYPPKKPDGFEA